MNIEPDHCTQRRMAVALPLRGQRLFGLVPKLQLGNALGFGSFTSQMRHPLLGLVEPSTRRSRLRRQRAVPKLELGNEGLWGRRNSLWRLPGALLEPIRAVTQVSLAFRSIGISYGD
jgi:hypothetical protein